MRLAALIVATIIAFVAHASATEMDFASRLLGLDGTPYRDCAKLNDAKTECTEWADHTLGLIAFTALDKPEANASMLDQAKRAVLQRKVYPGKNERHVVDLSGPEIKLLGDLVAKMGLRSGEFLAVMELLDPARLKSLPIQE